MLLFHSDRIDSRCPCSRCHTVYNESLLSFPAVFVQKNEGGIFTSRLFLFHCSSSSTDLSSSWELTNLRRVSDQFSSLGSVDSLEQVSHPYTASTSIDHLGGGKRDSAYSSFSTSSGTPDYTISKSNAASTENMLHKFSQWDSGGKSNSGRSSQDERSTYSLAPAVGSACEAPQTDDFSGSRHSTSSKTSFGPVWHVPEKKKGAGSSPPPPPPPARSDSFAATRVHERGLLAQTEGAEPKPCADGRRRSSSNLSPKTDRDAFHASDKSIPKQFSSHKLFSLSSSDVRQSQPCHQRHHSDKGTLYTPPWAPSFPKPQNVGGYYCSMQELPINGSAQHFGQTPRKISSTSSSNAAADQSADISGQSQYYCVAGKAEDPAKPGIEQKSLSPQPSGAKAKYGLPQTQQHVKDNNGYGKPQAAAAAAEPCGPKSNPEDRGGQRGPTAQASNCPSSRQTEQRRSLQPQHRESFQEIRSHGQAGNKISPQSTPLLHSLTLDVTGREPPSTSESLDAKQLRRSERFATTLRNEIQMRKAQMQKSRSVSTLPDLEGEADEDPDIWEGKNTAHVSAGGSFTNAYKVNLKEAQARVLMATSFRRKDLEPVLLENPTAETLPSYPPSALTCKDAPPLPPVLEAVANRPGPAGQVSRIGGRKRFPTEKKVRSFSEPDKIHEVGVKEELSCHENPSSSLEQEDLFKESGKSAFFSHVPPQSSTENPSKTKEEDPCSRGGAEGTVKSTGIKEYSQEIPGGPQPTNKASMLDQQRLGTFAEYEAKWSTRGKKPETPGSGRYRSVDNILNPGPVERAKSTCFHERSRSSPSADGYGQVRITINQENGIFLLNDLVLSGLQAALTFIRVLTHAN